MREGAVGVNGEQAMREAKRQQVPYFHITSVAASEEILKRGLKGGVQPRHRGEGFAAPVIFVVIDDQLELLQSIAMGQIWPFQDKINVAVLAIDPLGISGRVFFDDVAELPAPWQRVIEQEVIEPQFVRLHALREFVRQPFIPNCGAEIPVISGDEMEAILNNLRKQSAKRHRHR